jgi:hypothetical protein
MLSVCKYQRAAHISKKNTSQMGIRLYQSHANQLHHVNTHTHPRTHTHSGLQQTITSKEIQGVVMIDLVHCKCVSKQKITVLLLCIQFFS